MTGLIDKKSYVPIYVQIQEDLMRLVEEHEDSHKPFFSDDELTKRYEVSRLTVRRAVEKLVDDGYLYRVRGVGTFVTSPKLKVIEHQAYSETFEDQCRQAGKACVVTVTGFALVDAPVYIKETLGLADKAFYLERIRTVEGIPMVLDKFYFPPQTMENITPEECSHLQMAQIYAKSNRDKPAYQTIEAEAVLPYREDAQKLNTTEADPVLLRSITVFRQDGSPAVTGKTLNRGDLFKLVVQIPLQID